MFAKDTVLLINDVMSLRMLLSDTSKVGIDGIVRIKELRKSSRRQYTVCQDATATQPRGKARYDKLT